MGTEACSSLTLGRPALMVRVLPLAGQTANKTLPGAPECYYDSPAWTTKISDKADIWSLGCVLHELLTWVVLGRDGLTQYRCSRREEIAQIPRFADADCFHDGSDRLQSVSDVTEKIRSAELSRNADYIICQLLSIVEGMLESDPEARPDAINVSKRFDQRIKEAEQRYNIRFSDHLTAPRTPPGRPPYLSRAETLQTPDQRLSMKIQISSDPRP